MLGIERIVRIKGKSFEDLTASEVAEMIMADSAISPNGSKRFSACALDEFLNYGVTYSPELEKIRSEILAEIYIDVHGQKTKKINVDFLKRYSSKLASQIAKDEDPLISDIKLKLIRYPSLRFSESQNSIIIHASDSENGFDVGLFIDEGVSSSYTVTFGDWHGHFDTADDAGEFFAFGLSNECRLRVISRGNKPYKWFVESLEDGEWVINQELGLFLYTFWQKKSEKIFQNSIIKE